MLKCVNSTVMALNMLTRYHDGHAHRQNSVVCSLHKDFCLALCQHLLWQPMQICWILTMDTKRHCLRWDLKHKLALCTMWTKLYILQCHKFQFLMTKTSHCCLPVRLPPFALLRYCIRFSILKRSDTCWSDIKTAFASLLPTTQTACTNLFS